MQFMVIERFRSGRVKAVYERFAEKGRMLLEGVSYIDSWINEDVTVCYQVMEAAQPQLLQPWIDAWNDLIEFEVIPVISSLQAKEKTFGMQ